MTLNSRVRARFSKKAVRAVFPLTVVIFAGAALGGCSSAVSSIPTSRFSQLMRGYDNTLTPAQQKQAIAELKQDAKQADDDAKN